MNQFFKSDTLFNYERMMAIMNMEEEDLESIQNGYMPDGGDFQVPVMELERIN